MRIFTHKKFDKAFAKQSAKVKTKFFRQLALFQKNKRDKQLNNHALVGSFLGYRSFDVTDDVRIIFEELDSKTILLVNIGTHFQLYG